MRINESMIKRIIAEEVKRALREGSDDEDLMMKFIEAQRDIAPRFRNLYGQKPNPIDNVREDVYAVVSKINDEFERVGFDVGEYMEALSSALKERDVMIEYNIDDYSDRPLSSIDVVSEDESDENLDEARKKGKSVVKKGGKKASAGSIATFKKAAKKVKNGEKKKRAGFDAVKKSAEKWGAEDPAAVAQAATMVATGEPVVAKGEKRKLKNESVIDLLSAELQILSESYYINSKDLKD